MINKKITTLLSSIAFVATTAPGWAQDQLSTVSPAAAQSSTSGLAGDIVVTARRREENLQDVPVAIKIGRAHVCTPATNSHLVCRLLLDNKKNKHNSTLSLT